jgi:O-antigen/teichoic acid export membrane protein
VSRQTLSTVFWTNIALSLLIYFILWFAAPYIAGFYHEPILTDVSRVTFLVIPLGALSIIQFTLCSRGLEFRKMCIISITASIISCIIAIIWAWRTHSVWALVVQNVMSYALRALGFWLTTKFRPALTFASDELRRLFAFSRNLLITGLIGNIFNNIYTLLIGRFYGATQAGYFVQADRIRLVTSNSMTQVVQSVSYPILSQINNSANPSTPSNLYHPYRRIILVTLLFVGFLMTLLMSVGEDLMQLLMGSAEWRVAGQYLMALGVVGILYPLHAVNQNILLVKKMGRTVLWIEIARRALMIVLIVAALQFGVEVFVWSYALYSFLLIFLNLYVCGRPIGYNLMAQLRDISPILMGFLLMIVVAECSNHILSMQSLILRFTITLSLTLIVGLLYFHRHPSFREAHDLATQLLKSKYNQIKP